MLNWIQTWNKEMISVLKKYFIKNIEKKYRSCCFLEYGGIHFISDHQIRPCCTLSDYSYETLMALTADCDSRSFDIETYNNLIKKIKESNKTKKSICANCGYYKKQNWEDINSPYLINHRIILSHYTLCNFRCSYCTIDNNDYKKRPPNILPILSDMLNKKLISPKAIVEFSGGEPALLPYHTQLINLFKQNGNRIIFISNCSIFSQAIYDYLSISEGSYLLPSLDAGTEETFKLVRGRNMFNKVKKNIYIYAQNKYKNGKSKVALKYIFTEYNISDKDLFCFIDFCKEINPFRVVLAVDFVTSLKNGKECNELYFKLIEKIQQIKDILIKSNIAVEVASYDFNSYGMYYPEGIEGDTRVNRTYLE